MAVAAAAATASLSSSMAALKEASLMGEVSVRVEASTFLDLLGTDPGG